MKCATVKTATGRCSALLDDHDGGNTAKELRIHHTTFSAFEINYTSGVEGHTAFHEAIRNLIQCHWIGCDHLNAFGNSTGNT